MEKVYVYKSGDTFRVSPAVVGLEGGDRLRLINATDTKMTVTFPRGSVNDDKPVEKEIRPRGKVDVRVRDQEEVTEYTYTVKPEKGPKAKANSDPILIIEN